MSEPRHIGEWIAVADRLPQQGQFVLVWFRSAYGQRDWKHGVAEFAVLPEEHPDFPMWHTREEYSTREVSHWQPLPTPP